jgi:hypothetical protein
MIENLDVSHCLPPGFLNKYKHSHLYEVDPGVVKASCIKVDLPEPSVILGSCWCFTGHNSRDASFILAMSSVERGRYEVDTAI